MAECLFCKIVSGDVPCSKIYEDDLVLAFLDIGPVNPGHVLVIPKQHYENLVDMPEEVCGAIFVATKRVATAVKNGMKADGFNIGMNNGAASGQVVFHAHIHIMPRTEGDGLKLWPSGEYGDGEMEEVKVRITDALNNP